MLPWCRSQPGHPRGATGRDRRRASAVVAALLVAWPLAAIEPRPRLAIDTELGSLIVELQPERAPITVANFLRYVDEGLFADAGFYRVVHRDNDPEQTVKIEVVQGGRFVHGEVEGREPIDHEITAETGLRHLDGAISMARNEPGSATSEFFICVGPQPELDFGGARNPDGQGFAVFGHVVEGMEVVHAIHRSPHRGQRLEPPIPFQVRRLAEGADEAQTFGGDR